MAKREPRTLKDGLFSALGGMDSGRSPSLIDPDQVAKAVNVTMRGGYPRTRPGLPERELDFENEEIEDWFLSHELQGYFCYRSSNSPNFFIVSVGGRFFKIEVMNGYAVTEVTPTKATATSANFTAPGIGISVDITVDDANGIFVDYPIIVNGFRYMVTAVVGNVISATNLDDTTAGLVTAPVSVIFLNPNSPTRRRAWFEQAKQWLIAQNGLDGALLFDGSSMRRAVLTTDKPEVPTGTVMAYANNRLHVAVPGNQVALGDIVGGPTDVIVFSEELGITGPARFQFDDEITSMSKTVTLDTSMGQGPVQVFTRNSAGSINVPAQRSLWSTLTYAVQTVSLNNSGATSQYSTVQVNSDIHYRAPDGWRTFLMARREVSEWGSTPVSGEMDTFLNNDDISLLEYSSAVLDDNRVIFTINPHFSDNGVIHDGVAVLDFHLISRMGQKSRPVWDGAWWGSDPETPLRATFVLQGEFAKKKRAFVFALNDDDENVLYEIDKASTADDSSAITCRLEMRSMNFVGSGSNGTDYKKLWGAELWVDEVKGTVNFDLNWKPDQSPCEFDWSDKSICSLIEDCDQNTEACKTIQCYKPGYRTRIGFGQPPDDNCEAQNLKPSRCGYEFQPILEWQGNCRIRKFLLKSIIAEEEPDPPCDEEDDCRTQCGVFNEAQTFTAECPEGEVGDSVTVTVLAGRYAADTLANANALALAVAQTNAEAELECCQETSGLPPLNNAVYDSGRDAIFAVMGGRVLKCEGETGELISESRFMVPSLGDSYITYCAANDRLYAVVWVYIRPLLLAERVNLFKINPDTLAVEESWLVNVSQVGTAAGDLGFGFGPKHVFCIGSDIYGIYAANQHSGQTTRTKAWKFNVSSEAFTSSTDISCAFLSHWTFMVLDTPQSTLWIPSDSGTSTFRSIDLSTLALGALTSINMGSSSVGKMNGVVVGTNIYCVLSGSATPTSQFVLKKRTDNSGSVTNIDTTRSNALPFWIRYNSVNDRLYVPTYRDDTVVIINPNTDTVESVKTGFDSPFDVVFTPTKAFAVQHASPGLMEIV